MFNPKKVIHNCLRKDRRSKNDDIQICPRCGSKTKQVTEELPWRTITYISCPKCGWRTESTISTSN